VRQIYRCTEKGRLREGKRVRYMEMYYRKNERKKERVRQTKKEKVR